MITRDVRNRVNDHLLEVTNRGLVNPNQVVGIFLQGSQNYGLDLPTSDVDTKLLVVPSLYDLAMNSKPVSTTHIRENDEHTDIKDIRPYIQLFRKQNTNFLEILFTEYYKIFNGFDYEWCRLVQQREAIARLNPRRAMHSMIGIAAQKFHAMEKPFEGKKDVLEKYGYDPKQLHHLCRMNDFIAGYWMGESFADCLKPADPEYLLDIKRGKYSLEEARRSAARTMHDMDTWLEMANTLEDKEDKDVVDLLNDVQYNIVKIGIQNEVEQY